MLLSYIITDADAMNTFAMKLLLIVLLVLSLSNVQSLSELAIEQNEQDNSQLLSLLRRASQILLLSARPKRRLAAASDGG